MPPNVAELSLVVKGKDEASSELAKLNKSLAGTGKAAEDSSKQASGLGKVLGDVGKIAAGFAIGQGLMKLPGILGGITAGGSDLELQTKKSSIVFGDQIGVVDDWAKSNAKAMGLTKNEAVGLAAGLADLLIPMGMTREEAAQLSTKTIGLAGALAEWSEGTKTAAEVSDILTKAYLGETDGLKALGISISAADVSQRLLEKGQQDLTGTARQQAEALAIQEMIFEKSTDAQNAFANGADSAARKQAELTAKSKELKEQMGAALLPVMTQALDVFGKLPPELQTAVGAMQMFAPAIAPIMAGLAALLPMIGSVGLALLTPPLGFVTVLVAAGVAAYIFRDEILGAFNAVLGFVRDHWKDIAVLVSGPFAPILIVATDAFGIRSALVEAFGKAKDFIAGVFDGVLEGALRYFRGAVNTVIGLINDAISAYNKLPLAPDIEKIRVVSEQAAAASRLRDDLGIDSSSAPSDYGDDYSAYPAYAAGTPYVPRTGLAMLHRGEAVVPAAQNPNAGGEQAPTIVNVYLDGALISSSMERRQNRQLQLAARGV